MVPLGALWWTKELSQSSCLPPRDDVHHVLLGRPGATPLCCLAHGKAEEGGDVEAGATQVALTLTGSL